MKPVSTKQHLPSMLWWLFKSCPGSVLLLVTIIYILVVLHMNVNILAEGQWKAYGKVN